MDPTPSTTEQQQESSPSPTTALIPRTTSLDMNDHTDTVTALSDHTQLEALQCNGENDHLTEGQNDLNTTAAFTTHNASTETATEAPCGGIHSNDSSQQPPLTLHDLSDAIHHINISEDHNDEDQIAVTQRRIPVQTAEQQHHHSTVNTTTSPSPATNNAVTTTEYQMPSRITVHIHKDNVEDNEHEGSSPSDPLILRTIHVDIEKEYLRYRKPYLGGYKHRLKQTVHLHASTQTNRHTMNQINKVHKIERQTQTSKYVTKGSQTAREQGTQMSRYDVYVDGHNDTYKTPFVNGKENYQTGDQLEELREVHAREIQCFIRMCFAYRTIRQLQEQRENEETKRIEEEQRRKAEYDAEESKQLNRRMNPRTAADFQILHYELEQWKYAETRRIKEQTGVTPEQMNEQLEALLFKEIQLLQTIEKLKKYAVKEAKTHETERELQMMSSPKEWLLSALGGVPVQVTTPEILHSRGLVELYYALQLNEIPLDQRLDILHTVKQTISVHPSIPGVTQLLSLIDREIDLLQRQRHTSTLFGLRQRILSLYLQFVRDPMVNKEAEKYQKMVKPEEVIQSLQKHEKQKDKVQQRQNRNKAGDHPPTHTPTEKVLYGRSQVIG